jgi:hypothetical protein
MALKHFHILFVGLAFAFCACTAVLCWSFYRDGQGDAFRTYALVCAVACPLLLAYGFGFYNKIKRIHL